MLVGNDHRGFANGFLWTVLKKIERVLNIYGLLTQDR